jgi:hypothetical protein
MLWARRVAAMERHKRNQASHRRGTRLPRGQDAGASPKAGAPDQSFMRWPCPQPASLSTITPERIKITPK